MAEIEYFYAAHSAYAYLGSARLMEIAATAGRRIAHKPYDLRSGIAGIGSKTIGERTAGHLEYFFGREVERWSEFRNAPVLKRLPTHHHKSITLSNTMLIAGIVQGLNIDRLAHAMLEKHWRDDVDLADTDTLASIAKSVHLDPDPLFATSGSKEVLGIYEANTKEAIERSVFGSPTYVVDGDMFYGQDRLEMVERALSKPFTTRLPA
ncbi:MAG: 2-hydroxychromene-2-carboxylate isomerase [Alphaproteobacteria bacterium]|nr:2-hydroxychromene-2-carboxylate isomerase [Alphaproteobacteria bacterium]